MFSLDSTTPKMHGRTDARTHGRMHPHMHAHTERIGRAVRTIRNLRQRIKFSVYMQKPFLPPQIEPLMSLESNRINNPFHRTPYNKRRRLNVWAQNKGKPHMTFKNDPHAHNLPPWTSGAIPLDSIVICSNSIVMISKTWGSVSGPYPGLPLGSFLDPPLGSRQYFPLVSTLPWIPALGLPLGLGPVGLGPHQPQPPR